ncbi:hypothetical protein B0T25DRAFT_560365 [Lasiosphaeria hispida]|uniref:Secreted protein n=1 Tax=Lasiosphaeria hispida TaxID=260671 RepID=A0AAJ0H4W9_9PEZI|nr:hypothetical protein B0T25DRAFT_560365 [Lasiosphaeria hispida]
MGTFLIATRSIILHTASAAKYIPSLLALYIEIVTCHQEVTTAQAQPAPQKDGFPYPKQLHRLSVRNKPPQLHWVG